MKVRNAIALAIFISASACGVREPRSKNGLEEVGLAGKWKSYNVGCEKYITFQKDRVFQEKIICQDGKAQVSTGLYTYDNEILTLDYIRSSCEALHNIKMNATFQISDGRLVVTDLVTTQILQREQNCESQACQSTPAVTGNGSCVTIINNNTNTNTNTNTNNQRQNQNQTQVTPAPTPVPTPPPVPTQCPPITPTKHGGCW